jgi:hypothetical protein
MEWNGVPLDTEALTRLRARWEGIKGRLIGEVNREYGVFVPVGQCSINPESTFGAAVLQEAEAWGIDARRLADAADVVWREERQATEETYAARRAARQATGLTASRINRWEDAGRDHSDYAGLDSLARDLADRYPALGIGPGYDPDAPDEVDHAGRLWEVLRDRAETPKPRHNPDILRRAAEMVAASPGDGSLCFGPMRFCGTLGFLPGLLWHSVATVAERSAGPGR